MNDIYNNDNKTTKLLVILQSCNFIFDGVDIHNRTSERNLNSWARGVFFGKRMSLPGLITAIQEPIGILKD